VIEAKLDRGRGPVATVLVQRGTSGSATSSSPAPRWAAFAPLINDQGVTIDEAEPSVPVEVLGFNGPPEAGDRLAVVEERGPRPRSHELSRPPEARKRRRQHLLRQCAVRSSR